MKSDELIQRALENIIEDRDKLKELYESMKKAVDVDPFAAIAASENIVKVADSLTKQTGQLVELAKIKQKSELLARKKLDGDELDSDDVDEVYAEIGLVD